MLTKNEIGFVTSMSKLSLNFSYAYGEPRSCARFRQTPEDFVVDEIFETSLTNEGEHFWLRIKKRGENTDWIAKKLANYFSVRTMDVGYGGKKDRHAITSQWFSVYLPKTEHKIDWSRFLDMSGLDAELISCASHRSKLKKGEHSANRFVIRLHELSDIDSALERLEQIKSYGIPNYFGEQRFGRDAANLQKVLQWINDPRSIRSKNLRGLIISSARSYLFNRVLSERVKNDTWQAALSGDISENEASGPLWGRGRPKVELATHESETEVLEGFSSWCAALENVGLLQERRSLVLQPRDFSWQKEGSSIEMSMTLRPGEYATSVLRELSKLSNVANDDKIG